MSSRVLRDDLWTSEPIGRLHDKTFRLYVCLINAADDYGLVDTGFGEISRAAPLARWAPEDVQKMLAEMFDSEVLLPYRVQSKSFCAIDKWQCFMRSVKPKHPIPSFGLGHIRMPYGFKNQRVRASASLLLKHLDIKGTTPGMTWGGPGDALGHEGSRELGVGKKGEKKEKEQDAAPVDPKAEVWSIGIDVLTSTGLPEKLARSFLGSMAKTWPAQTVLDACRAAVGKVEPKAYIAAFLKEKPKIGQTDPAEHWD